MAICRVRGGSAPAVAASIATVGNRAAAFLRVRNELIDAVSEIDVGNAEAAELNAFDLARYAVVLLETAKVR